MTAPLPPVPVLLAGIPSPSSGVLRLGPLSLRAYGLCIALGVIVAVTVSDRRWRARGGAEGTMGTIASWAVPAGVVGARLYHVITDWRSFRGRWFDAVKVWEGGLGIWGGVALGVVVGLVVARRRGVRAGDALDTVAPAIPLAQAIGRWGNWFNVELFGRPTALPWGLEVPPGKRPARFADAATFHPTFLYESLWNLLVAGLVVVLERRARRRGRSLPAGTLFAVYVAGYAFGRFWIERLRVDRASLVLGFRVNEWTAALCFVTAIGAIAVLRRRSRRAGQAAANAAQ